MALTELLRKSIRLAKWFYMLVHNRIKLYGKPDICFIWIPKAAGSSTFKLLEAEISMVKLKNIESFHTFPNYGPVTFGHAHYHSLQRINVISKRYHENSTKFAIVRNPYDRVVSLYNYLVQIGNYTNNFDDFLQDLLLNRPAIGTYNSSWISIANPQVNWLIGDSGKFVVDKLFKIENIAEFYTFLEGYGIKSSSTFPHENKSSGTIDLERDLMRNAERLDRVNRIYFRDFALLGYEMVAPEGRFDNVTRRYVSNLRKSTT